MVKRFKKKYILIAILMMCCAAILGIYFYSERDSEYICDQNSILISENSSDYTIKIKGNSNQAEIAFDSENLCTKGKKEKGLFQKTDWIVLDENQKFLCMYGGFDYVKWIFVDDKGRVTKQKCDDIHNDFINTTLENKSKCVVEIPEGSVAVKAYYLKNGNRIASYVVDCLKRIVKLQFDESIQELKALKKYYQDIQEADLYIVYGQVPVGAISYHKDELTVPLSNGEVELFYDKSKGWSYQTDKGYKQLDFHCAIYAGKNICYDKSTQIEVKSSGEVEREGIYGIRTSTTKDEMVGTRVGDSVGLHSNYSVEKVALSPYKNDFDNIYPWSEIKSCYVDDEGNVYYDALECSDEDIYNEMIEIPVFYSKREVIGDNEYIYISGKYHEGFEIDPAFVTAEGVCDKIYIGKYLASMVAENMGSYSSAIPMIDVSLEEIDENMKKKGDGWSELDLCTLNMLQRLWLVETAVKNSQSIFEGYTESSFIFSADLDPKYAQKTNGVCNYIDVRKTAYTKRFSEGESVVVFSFERENQNSAYLYFNDNYKNDDNIWQRKIEKIEDGVFYRRIYFSGEPIDIRKGESIIANLPQECGTTDSVPYHTGCVEGIYGKRSFKYRGIENLWGNVCVVLGGAYAENGELQVTYPDSRRKIFRTNIPAQEKSGGVARSYDCAVKNMVFDTDNSLIMFPKTIGDGATLTNNYGDWLAVPQKDFYVDTTKRQYLTYGMTWDLANYAGLFAYRVQPSYNSKRVENGGRVMMRSYK